MHLSPLNVFAFIVFECGFPAAPPVTLENVAYHYNVLKGKYPGTEDQ